MIPATPPGKSRKKSLIVGSIAGFAILTIAIASIVGFSVRSVTDNANNLDNNRSRSTVRAALLDFTGQLANVTRDNAYWDEAAIAVYRDNSVEWMRDVWATSVEDDQIYSGSLVVESDGTPLIAYEKGAALTLSPSEFYGPSFETLLKKARMAEALGDDDSTVSSLMLTGKGLTVVSMSPIMPSAADIKVDPAKRRYLVFSRHSTPADITAMGTEYVVPGLRFERTATPGLIDYPVVDAGGQTLGYLTWPAQNPGDLSFNRIAPYLSAALALLGLLMLGFFAFSRFLVKDINRDRLKAEHESTHDPLSGLLNRSGIFSKLDEMIANRTEGLVPTFIFLDLDGFKEVNDSYGHAVGDTLIRNVSAGILKLVPQSAHVSRLGGDEFAILLNDNHENPEAERIAAGIHRLLKEPFNIDGRIIVVGASIGIALANSQGISGPELVRQSDLAMYRAKDSGRGRTVFYQTGFDDERTRLHQLESDLRLAIEADELTVAYQPLVDAKTSKWHGVEALARWHNKRTGEIVGPDIFIALAERTGLIEMLGLQILRKALAESRNWPDLKISVNVSPAQFRNPAFSEHVARILADTGADPRHLILEITENSLVRKPERARQIVKALKGLGVSISLDDFGSGFSSIGYLRQFDFDRLKIDRSFISALDREANAPSVIQATVALANAFNIPVTAEGVEREEQAAVLRLTGCDEFQGFLFGKPMSANEINRILRDSDVEAVSAA